MFLINFIVVHGYFIDIKKIIKNIDKAMCPRHTKIKNYILLNHAVKICIFCLYVPH